MAITSDELTRTESPQFDYEVRVFTGPKRGQIAPSGGFELGEDFDPLVGTTLTVDVDTESTEIQVVDTTYFNLGGILIAPHSEGEVYEFIKYDSKTQIKFQQLTRQIGDGRDVETRWGVHTAGASVLEFQEITEKVAGLSLSFNEQDGAAFWTVRIDGWFYDSFLLDNDNAMVAQYRMRPFAGDYNNWSPWSLWWLGYIKNCEITDDSHMGKQWRANVEGISQYVAATDVDPRHYGRNDIADGKSITVSSYLKDPYQEWGTGEYDGFPSLDGDQVNDGDLATLWISEGEPTHQQEQHIASNLQINEVFLRPRPGYSTRDHQWIELSFKRGDGAGVSLNWYSLTNKQTTWKKVQWELTDPDGDPYDPPRYGEAFVPDNNYVELRGGKLDPSGEFVILTFNYPKFIEKYPSHGANRVVDMRPLIVGDFELDPTGDFLCLRNFHTNTESIVWWSNGNSSWESQAPYNFNGDEQDWWSGQTMISVPPEEHTFRRYPTGNAPDLRANDDGVSYWRQDEKHPTPGYYTTGEAEWVSVDLGETGIALDGDLAAGETGSMNLNKEPLGLAEAGWVLVNQEIIKYDTRNSSGNSLDGLTRGVSGTQAVTQPDGSLVKGLDSVGGTATTNHLISSTRWRRRPVRSGGVYMVPQDFEVLASEFIDPIYPDNEDWDNEEGKGGRYDYWETLHKVSGHGSTSWIGAMDARRARHVMMIIKKMKGGGRAKINQWHVYADQVDLIEAPPDADEEIRDFLDGAYSGVIIYHLLTDIIGLEPYLFELEDPGRPFVDIHTSTSTMLQLIKDICRRTGTSTVFELDERVIHRFDPFYPLSGLEDVEIYWDYDNTRKVVLSRPFRHNVRQVILRAHEPEQEEHFVAKYPPTPLDLGSTVEVEDWVLSDPVDADLMAHFIFRQRNAPLTAVITPVGPAEWVRPGQRHVIDWELDEGGEYLIRRNFVVTGAQWDLDFGSPDDPSDKDWTTTIRLKELIF